MQASITWVSASWIDYKYFKKEIICGSHHGSRWNGEHPSQNYIGSHTPSNRSNPLNGFYARIEPATT
jgi:hypothetical protein